MTPRSQQSHDTSRGQTIVPTIEAPAQDTDFSAESAEIASDAVGSRALVSVHGLVGAGNLESLPLFKGNASDMHWDIAVVAARGADGVREALKEYSPEDRMKMISAGLQKGSSARYINDAGRLQLLDAAEADHDLIQTLAHEHNASYADEFNKFRAEGVNLQTNVQEHKKRWAGLEGKFKNINVNMAVALISVNAARVKDVSRDTQRNWRSQVH